MCLLSIGGTAFAAGLSESETNSGVDLMVTQKEISEYKEISTEFANELKSNSNANISTVIKKYFAHSNCGLVEKAEEVPYNENDSISDELILKYDITEDKTVTFTPYFIIVDESGVIPDLDACVKSASLSTSNNSEVKALATKSTKSTGTIFFCRSHYTYFGTRCCTVHVQCAFSYNGTKAWYKSDYDAYPTIEKSGWEKLSFSGVKEKSGTSYIARARGVFKQSSFITNYVLRVRVECSKDGKITKSYYPALGS